LHCSNLGAQALHEAIKNYREKKQKEADKDAVKNAAKDKVHTCPYCDDDIAEAAFPYCEACSVGKNKTIAEKD
jgi:nitrogen fixation protein NifU and related proteins